ncbi:acylphosphatase [Corynebacterium freiburgense]|uniref:acylphosphatase n=1 Tax=Corynebacterium freiburgense TaxID=556548 RepID=UPI0004138EFF|nr:acylphosphatase [Corynebacterium freiburgense]WJZ03060.1 Acylphosphatase [Corynebacterium freiburgense]
MTRLTAWVHGNVQGVGFRWWTRSQALELGLTGSATNLIDGRVCVVAEGPEDQVEALLRRLWALEPATYQRPGYVKTIIEQWGEEKGARGFAVN